jgi:hypothetical protein
MNQICNRRTELTFSSVLCTGSQRLSSCWTIYQK